MHLAAVPRRHAAPGRQGAVVAVATVCLETLLLGRALCGGELELTFLLFQQEGTVEAEQVVTEQRGQEKVEPQGGGAQQPQGLRPAEKIIRLFNWNYSIFWF